MRDREWVALNKILLIATGGTIASAEGGGGLTPAFDADQMIGMIPELKEICEIQGKIIMNVDSTNMDPDMMVTIAETIEEHYDDFDGFVVTHGTDTMGYTSAVLTYSLQNIKKPVVLTGSQLSIGAMYTDAKQNITDAVRFATEGMPGVFVAFDGKIINGTRAKKVRTKSMDAFESFNFPFVAQVKLGKITFNQDACQKLQSQNSKPYQINTSLCKDVMVIKLFTGMKTDIFDFLKQNYRGVIIESFGIGGVPNKNINILGKLKELMDEGVAVVITTQCVEEGIDLGIYEVGKELAKHPVIYAGDMNLEAIVAKLMWTLGNFSNLKDTKQFMETPFFGDLNQ